MTFGIDIDSKEQSTIENFDRYLYPEYYDSYNTEEISSFIENQNYDISTNQGGNVAKESNPIEMTQQLDGPMDSPWPMYCHDTRHTGRSPYSAANNPGFEKWRFELSHEVYGNVAIDENGIIYFGSNGVYALHPNGTLKWNYITHFMVHGTPAIDEDGNIYFGTIYGDTNFYALYPDGTLKWKLKVTSVCSSPTIGDDGTIYFGTRHGSSGSYFGYINAYYPNGTLRWKYKTNDWVDSSPAISEEGIIYCGSYDGYLYALYPNGTLKWQYPIGDKIVKGPSIADDGTIYFGSWGGHLYALYPNGTMKWKHSVDFGTTPIIGQDGTIYGGFYKLYAVYPNNGSIKWNFDPGYMRAIRGNPCISADGTIFFGTKIAETDGGELIAVNPDGTEKWRILLATCWIWSAPAIDEDGTVYVGSCNDVPPSSNWGYLHAIGINPDVPSEVEINGPTKGRPGLTYEYTFRATSPIDNDIYYLVDWGDNDYTGWIGPYSSGESITLSKKWTMQKNFIIKAQVKDTEDNYGPWTEFNVEIRARNRAYSNTLLLRLLEQFPLFERFLNLII